VRIEEIGAQRSEFEAPEESEHTLMHRLKSPAAAFARVRSASRTVLAQGKV